MLIRFQSAVPHRRGRFPGIFALVNGLLHDEGLPPDAAAWVRKTNAWFNMAYTDPATVIPDCYDPAANPAARSWFRIGASRLPERAEDYLELLDQHDVP